MLLTVMTLKATTVARNTTPAETTATLVRRCLLKFLRQLADDLSSAAAIQACYYLMTGLGHRLLDFNLYMESEKKNIFLNIRMPRWVYHWKKKKQYHKSCYSFAPALKLVPRQCYMCWASFHKLTHQTVKHQFI